MRYLARVLLLSVFVLPWGGCIKNLDKSELSDVGIRHRIETQLKARKDINLRYVQIDVHQRIVTVSGVVGSWEEQQAIESIVKRTRGVDQALSNLVIQE